MDNVSVIDFAISYASENSKIADEIYSRLRELGCSVFFADKISHLLVGEDAESFFEKIFTKAIQVIVLISKDYKRKDWPRYEWDFIRKRPGQFIPIRLDDCPILGLPSSIIYVPFNGNNFDEIVATCVKKLNIFKQENGIPTRPEFERIFNAIKNESKGALAEAYQLVKDQRTRTPLDNCELPKENYQTVYEIMKTEWNEFSTVKRLVIRILVPLGLSRDELRFNLKKCAAEEFNVSKPDAIMVFAYANEKTSNFDINSYYTAGRAVFAPFGKWEKARDGVAYNIPTQEFDYTIDFVEAYFTKG